MAAKLEPMYWFDAAWFHMDGATNLAMVTGVSLTHEPLDFARMREVFAYWLLHLRRFPPALLWRAASPTRRRTGKKTRTSPSRITSTMSRCPEPCDKQALLDLLSDIASTPLDYKRPLWQVHVVHGVDDGSAMIPGFHRLRRRWHGADGDCAVALRRAARRPALLPGRASPRPRRPSRHAGAPCKAAARPVGAGDQQRRGICSPPRTGGGVRAVGGAAGVGVAVGTLFKTPDPHSPLKGQLGIPKRGPCWSEPVELEKVKHVRKATHAKGERCARGGAGGGCAAPLHARAWRRS